MPKFVPRQRKQKARRREAQSGDAPQDTNALEITPLSKDEKEERRRKLREELRAQQPKISSKKQKRLDKYIVRLDILVSVRWHTD
jgi:ATP-dependent RNA helicase DHX37/DHR1